MRYGVIGAGAPGSDRRPSARPARPRGHGPRARPGAGRARRELRGRTGHLAREVLPPPLPDRPLGRFALIEELGLSDRLAAVAPADHDRARRRRRVHPARLARCGASLRAAADPRAACGSRPGVGYLRLLPAPGVARGQAPRADWMRRVMGGPGLRDGLGPLLRGKFGESAARRLDGLAVGAHPLPHREPRLPARRLPPDVLGAVASGSSRLGGDDRPRREVTPEILAP